MKKDVDSRGCLPTAEELHPRARGLVLSLTTCKTLCSIEKLIKCMITMGSFEFSDLNDAGNCGHHR